MKQNLGKFLLLLILLIPLYAKDFTYHIQVNRSNPYLKEPVLLSVDLNQTNPNTVLLFQFSVNPSKYYRVKQINARIDNTLHHASHHYLYELNPLTTGDVNITFSLTKRVTTDEKIHYFASGDRDDFKKLDTKDYPVHIRPLTLHVRPLPKGVKFIGNFTLDYQIKTHTSEAYKPIPLKITIKGRGYPPVIRDILPRNTHFTHFSDTPSVRKVATEKGTVITATYTAALSADRSFTLPAIRLKAFDPEKHREYFLEMPAQHFKINAVDKTSLVDKTDNPEPLHTDFSWFTSLLGYIVVFFAGYMTAFSLKWKRRVTGEKQDPLIEKIERCKDAKTLLQLLMSTDSTQFETAIEKLEKGLYSEEKINLKQIKQEVLERMK